MTQTLEQFSDEDLFAKFRAGDTDAGNVLFASWIPRLIKFCLNRGCSLFDAQDIVQETILAILKSKIRVLRGKFVPWICHITQNKIREIWRSKCRTVEKDSGDFSKVFYVDSGSFTPQEWLEATESSDESLDIRRIKTVLKKLDSKDRRVIRMRLFEEKSFSAIARIEKLKAKDTAHARYKWALRRAQEAFEILRDPENQRVLGNLTLGECKSFLNALTEGEADALVSICFKRVSIVSVARKRGVDVSVLYRQVESAARKIKKMKSVGVG